MQEVKRMVFCLPLDVLNASWSGPDASTDGYSGSDTAAPHGDSSSSGLRCQAAKGFWSYDGQWFPSIRAWEKSQGRKRPRGGLAFPMARLLLIFMGITIGFHNSAAPAAPENPQVPTEMIHCRPPIYH